MRSYVKQIDKNILKNQLFNRIRFYRHQLFAIAYAQIVQLIINAILHRDSIYSIFEKKKLTAFPVLDSR